MKYILVAILWGLSPGTARANNSGSFTQMKGDALRAVFTDTMMVGEYRQYRDLTRTFNYTEFHSKDGTTDYVEGRKKEDGRWKIIGNEKICYKYPGSRYYSQTYCFYVFNADGCYYKFTPENMTLNRNPRNRNRWSSRAVRKGAGGTCDEPVG
ncbi:MAG: hypothetical protein L3J65_02590 [Robiginitomaculum sp.]|nr:hypothetical protein [Robiginitomaculum sp.]